MAEASEAVLLACLERRETRSGHYRTDYPEPNDEAFFGCFVWRQENRELKRSTQVY
jgi:fumarate reductase (CoM/CoB) subunit A